MYFPKVPDAPAVPDAQLVTRDSPSPRRGIEHLNASDFD